jgi:hypothetical protein
MYYLLRPIVAREGTNGKNALFCFPRIGDFQCMADSWEFNPVVERERPYPCQVGSLPYSALCMAIVESSLLTIRTLATERAASRGHGGIGSGMHDGSGIGAKPSSWVFDFHGVLLSGPCLRLRGFKLFLAFAMLQ